VLVLALDTSTPSLTVAAADVRPDGVDVRAERDEVVGTRHGELLATALSGVLDAAGARPSDLAAVAVGLGPGPFTSLRVGIVTAAALADALAVPMYGVCSLDALALGRPAPSLLAVTDARRRQVYWARYAAGRRVDGPELSPPAELAARYAGEVPAVVGAGALALPDLFAAYDVDAERPYPRARDVAALVAERVRARAPGDPPDPLYLRRPDARPPAARKAVTPQ
jgi:tRNA threonylcarbamoyl adenosine modification protein YeaZ